VKHFNSSQQIHYETDYGNSDAYREKTSPSISQGKALAYSCPDLPVGQSQTKMFLRITKHKLTSQASWTPYLLLLSPSGI
jgi:hypothetical protein